MNGFRASAGPKTAHFVAEKERGDQEKTGQRPRDPGLPSSPGNGDGRNSRLRSALRDPLQLAPEIRGVLPAVLRVLRQGLLHDVVERRRRHRLNLRDRRRLVAQDRGDERRLRRTTERLLAGRHLVKHAPEREDVGARVGLSPLQLLRRHVLERPEDRPLLREVRAPYHRRKSRQTDSCRGMLRCGRLLPPGRVERRLKRPLKSLGQSEVEQLHARLRQHHVAGLQVPVHDPLPVRLVQRVGDLDPEAERLIERKRSLQETIRERLPFEVLHDEVLGLAFPTHVVQGADVRVRELRDRLRLPLEALPDLGRSRQVRRQHLDRHRAVQPRVPRPVHLPHPSRAERREDLVRTETGTGGERHLFRSLRRSACSRTSVPWACPEGALERIGLSVTSRTIWVPIYLRQSSRGFAISRCFSSSGVL